MNARKKIIYYKLEDQARVLGLSTPLSLFRFLLALFQRARPEKNISQRAADFVAHAPTISRVLGAWRFIERREKRFLSIENQMESVSVIRSKIVKPFCTERERGIILISFESELDKLAMLRHLPGLEKQYRILFLPTWQPFHSLALFRFNWRTQKQHSLMPSSLETEKKLIKRFSGHLDFLPFHAASWVPKKASSTIRRDRDIDFLMIANFARHKRHWRLFQALATMPESVSVTLAGMPRGKRDLDALMEEARLFGVDRRVRILAAPSSEVVSDLLSRAKVFCAMTYKEGSFISVAEALMHGVSVVMFKNAYIGSRHYINEVTGRFIEDNNKVGEQMMKALDERADPVTISQWAAENISAEVNSKKLNHYLKQKELSAGNEWTQDIEPFYCKHFRFLYFDEKANKRLEGEYARVHERFGLSFV